MILEFEGVYPTAKVYLNEELVSECFYGYSMFYVPLTGLLKKEENLLRVVADNSEAPNSRWYSGAGIYRPVWLLQAGREYIIPGSLRITTESIAPAVITVECEAVGEDLSAAAAIAKDCKTVLSFDLKKDPESGKFSGSVTVPDAKLWSAESPELYQAEVVLFRGGLDESAACDIEMASFGIRTLSWSKEGFFVNGKETLLAGGCVHHDNGILGARSDRESEWRRVSRLKEFGYNAIRSSHYPMSRAAIEACDALGMYVMDELWDMWFQSKNPYDYAR